MSTNHINCSMWRRIHLILYKDLSWVSGGVLNLKILEDMSYKMSWHPGPKSNGGYLHFDKSSPSPRMNLLVVCSKEELSSKDHGFLRRSSSYLKFIYVNNLVCSCLQEYGTINSFVLFKGQQTRWRWSMLVAAWLCGCCGSSCMEQKIVRIIILPWEDGII